MTKKHYTYIERLAINTMLNKGKNIKEISVDIKRPSSGIIKEINKNITCKFPTFYNKQHPCLKYSNCNVRGFECYLHCKDIEYKVCPKLEKSPHVCNGCTSKYGCRYIKRYYNARDAHDSYKANLSNSRTGLHYTEQELIILNERLCPLIIRSKSVYHAVTTINNVFELSFNKHTIYKQIERKQLPILASDLPRPRKKQKSKTDRNYKRVIEGHTYDDYEKYLKDNPEACEMQMDTVEGIKENNHELIRRVIPKGVSLKPYTQKEVNLLCSHINSLCRESLDGKSPFDLVNKYISETKIDKLGLSKIDPLDVCLIPDLLGIKNINNIKKYLDNQEIKKANISVKSESK